MYGRLQSPQIEDEGNGVSNEPGDGDKADLYVLGQDSDPAGGASAKRALDADGSGDPTLSEPGPLNSKILAGAAVELSVRAVSPAPLTQVMAVLVPPNYDAAAGTGTPIEVVLAPDLSDPSLYKGTTSGMVVRGTWWVNFMAESTPGSQAMPVTIHIEVDESWCGRLAAEGSPSGASHLAALLPLMLVLSWTRLKPTGASARRRP